MSPAYDTLTEALAALRRQGFTLDFNLRPDRLHCPQLALDLFPDDFELVAAYRFEGPTDPADAAVLYALEGRGGVRGTLVDGYGASAEALSPALARKLAWKPGHSGT